MNVRTKIFWDLQRRFFIFLALLAFLFVAHLPEGNTLDFNRQTVSFSKSNAGFADLIERVGPAVVNIRVVSEKPQASSMNSFFSGDDFFNELFSHFFQNLPGKSESSVLPEVRHSPNIVGIGSGFLISPDGYIMTNAHVVDGGHEIKVKLKDVSGEVKAKVIGIDTLSDLAVIKIEQKGLPYLVFGDSDKIRVGEWVVAIGSPFDLENSVTVGILSAKYRHIGGVSVDGLSQYPFLQTDAALNRGNSGGPLLNVSGEVVGINSQILSGTGEFAGVSFSVPSNLAKEIFEQLKQKGYVRRGRIGVQVSDLDPAAAQVYKLPLGRGVLVANVDKKGPAAKAGVKVGDIILSFNGEKVTDARSIQNAVSRTKPGSLSRLELLRGEKRIVLHVSVEELSHKDRRHRERPGSLNVDGVMVEPGEFQFCQKNHAQIGCVVVQSVDRNSRFSGVLHRGDVILEVNRYPIADIDIFRKRIDLSARNGLLLLVSHKSAVRLVSVQ